MIIHNFHRTDLPIFDGNSILKKNNWHVFRFAHDAKNQKAYI